MDLKPKDNSSESVSAAEQTDTEQTLLVEGAAASDEDRASSIAQKHRAEKETKRILTVDDTDVVVKLVKIHLERHRYEVISANDGQEGLEKVKTEKPDLIVLDLMLPKINGYKVCGLLKVDSSNEQ